MSDNVKSIFSSTCADLFEEGLQCAGKMWRFSSVRNIYEYSRVKFQLTDNGVPHPSDVWTSLLSKFWAIKDHLTNFTEKIIIIIHWEKCGRNALPKFACHHDFQNRYMKQDQIFNSYKWLLHFVKKVDGH